MSTLVTQLLHWWENRRDPLGPVRIALRPHENEPRGLEIMTEDAHRNGKAAMLTAMLHQVRFDDLIISQPMLGSVPHQLRTNQKLRLAIAAEKPPSSGATHVISRVKIVQENGAAVFGYRVAIPERLVVEERREHPRIMPSGGGVFEIELHVLERELPIRGVLADVSMSGMQIRTRAAHLNIEQGQRVLLKAQLPDPVGAFSEMAEIIRLDRVEGSDCTVIGVRLIRPIDGMKVLIRDRNAWLHSSEADASAPSPMAAKTATA